MPLVDTITVTIKAIDKFTATVNAMIPAINALQYEFMRLKAEASERHAEWFCSLPGWKRILWQMAYGAYLVKIPKW